MTNLSTCSNATILARCGQMTDPEWFALLEKSATNQPTEGIELPGFPPEDVQRLSIGSVGAVALIDGKRLYTVIKEYAHHLGVALDPLKTTILDFGCGWGRITRFFLKDVMAENLHGLDVMPEMIQFCKSTIPHGNFTLCNPEPPTGFAANTFDIIFAFSVFSHLAEPVHIKWIEEFSRILKPGGILVATTQPRRFLDLCESLRGTYPDSHWREGLARSFTDIKAAYADYDNGKFLYSATGGAPPLDSSFYGEALIPPLYIQRVWTKYLKFREFIDDVKLLNQAVVVMQKADNDS